MVFTRHNYEEILRRISVDSENNALGSGSNAGQILKLLDFPLALQKYIIIIIPLMILKMRL
jgi:hypothetical protein